MRTILTVTERSMRLLECFLECASSPQRSSLLTSRSSKSGRRITCRAWFTLPVLLAVIVVKEFLSRRVFAVGDDLDSSALKGDAWHHRSDAITSAAAAIGITIALIGGKGWEAADDWGALAACVVIVTNAFLIVRTSVYDATDRAVAPELREAISSVAAQQTGVRRIEKCVVRKSGTGLFVELHVELDPRTTIEEGHRVGHRVKAALIAANRRIKDVLVHLEPEEPPVTP